MSLFVTSHRIKESNYLSSCLLFLSFESGMDRIGLQTKGAGQLQRKSVARIDALEEGSAVSFVSVFSQATAKKET